jgi:hypothetical protein
VIRKGEKRQTHKRYFSQSTKLPSKILPSHGPADSFIYMSTSFPYPDKEHLITKLNDQHPRDDRVSIHN